MLKRLSLLLALLWALCCPAMGEALVEENIAVTDDCIVEYGFDYLEAEEVALYLHAFAELPLNYLTKSEARALGWDSRAGNLWEVAYGCAIGGDSFGSREGLLPDARGRRWYECDVNYFGGYRGAERIVFSNDGLICYSDDHYQSYEILYDDWYDPSAAYADD